MFARCRAVYMLVALLLFASAGQAGEGRLVQRVYAVSDLVVAADNESESTTSEEQLIKLITDTIAPRSWSGKGGRGTIDYHPLTMALVVNQTPEVQDQIADLLTALRRQQEMQVSVEVKFVEVPKEMFQDLKRKGLLGKPHKKKHAPDNVSFLDDAGVLRFIEAVQNDPHFGVMQASKMTMFSGKKTAFNAVEPRKFVTGMEVVRGDKGPQYKQKTEIIPLGVQLSLQPLISADGRFVRVHLDAKMNDLVSDDLPLLPITTRIEPRQDAGPDAVPVVFTTFTQEPRVNKLGVNRTLNIPDGNTAVLTGLSKKCEVRTEYEVPVLSQIPVVGRMFRSIGYGCETHQVLVLVTPRIQARQETKEKHARKVVADMFEAIHRCHGEKTDYAYRTPIFGPFRGQDPQCSEAPAEGRILRALPPLRRLAGVLEESRDNVQIATERIVDKIDPPRFFPLVGLAQLHRCQWKCSVYYQETIKVSYPFCFRWTQPRMDVVYVDTGHLHLVAKEESPAK
ncbi:MAG TPA: hypothetical protein VMG10_22585 [Gemmataceae bacterium]|nr:hypothetical protein [Gemmataceae bacterium]